MTVDEMLQAGIAACKAGDNPKAKQLLTSVVQANPQSELGWLWLGESLTLPDQQAYCFRRVLALNPNHTLAQQKLVVLSGSAPANSAQAISSPPAPAPFTPLATPQRSGEVDKERVSQRVAPPTGEPLQIKRISRWWLGGLIGSVFILALCSIVGVYFFISRPTIPSVASNSTPVKTEPVTPQTITPTLSVLLTASPTVRPSDTPTVTPNLTAEYRPVFVRETCAFDLPLKTKVECGSVIVPEDRQNPASPNIRLAVAVYRSQAQTVAPDPVIFLQGGPGNGALLWSSLVYSTIVLPIVQERDFIVFDQRGTGLSEPSLQCPELARVYVQDYQATLTHVERESLYTAALLDCRKRLTESGTDPAAYTTIASAADVKDILTALKYQKPANLYGVSYGTRLAQVVMREHPEIVRSSVLDSVLPLEVKLYNQGSSTSDYALQTLFRGCAEDLACRTAFPQLETIYTDLIEQLDRKPITITTSLPLIGQSETAVTGLALTTYLLWVLQRSELIAFVPQALYRLHNGEDTFLPYVVSLPPATLSDISMGVFISINCHEQVYATTPEELGTDQAKHPNTEAVGLANIYGSGEALFQICALWQAKPLAAGETAPVVSDLPTLIIAGTYDPTTPPSFGQQLARHLNHHYFFEFPNEGHGPTTSSAPCPMQVVTAFFHDPSVEPDRTCLTATQPISFIVPYTGTPPIELVAYTDQEVGVAGLRPAHWTAIGAGFYSRSSSLLDRTQIGQQSDPTSIADWLIWLDQQFFGRQGFDHTPVQTGKRRSAQLVWELYRTTSAGLPVDLAFAKSGSQTLLVIMQSYADEHDAMYQTVFLPLVDKATLAK